MTSEFKTNEFLRRRKLRLQQVREQSKDIAKKIRLRAKFNKLQEVDDIEAKREYLQHQDKFVKKLELLYAQKLENVGASHKIALGENDKDLINHKRKSSDVSILRAKEAAAELKKQKQAKLDERKKLLDRKLQARETANIISREKSTAIASKVLKSKQTNVKTTEELDKQSQGHEAVNETNAAAVGDEVDKPKTVTSDMATQWDSNPLPNDWIPEIPVLELTKDKDNFNKETVEATVDCNRPEKNKRLNLFALSDEMPSSLRGGLITLHEEEPPIKTSLTMVSEFLQNRGLRLREPDPTITSKKQNEDLHSIRQTIARTRASTTQVKNVATDKSTVSSSVDIGVTKKKSVTMYNHLTKDSRDIPLVERPLVSRDKQCEEDAYSYAMKELAIYNSIAQEDNRIQEVRSKVAVTKQTVEKEYQDTLSFLNSLPKDNNTKTIRKAFMDESRQEKLNHMRQQKMQQEFKKIEKDRKQHCCKNQAPKATINSKSKSKSPSGNNEFASRDFQYSWMPVPESDNNLAIHTIPTSVKPGKSENVVKFSQVDSYHEYRSRHKHTPPTKDSSQDKRGTRVEEPKETSDCSVGSDTSSVENLRNDMASQDKQNDESDNFSDSERIIIYKILESQSRKRKTKKKSKLSNVRPMDNVVGKGISKTIKLGEDNVFVEQQLDEGIYKTVTEKGVTYNALSCYTTNVGLWQPYMDRQPWWDNITNMYFSESPREDGTTADSSKCCHKKSTSAPEETLTSGDNKLPSSQVERPCSCSKNKRNGTSAGKDKQVEPSTTAPPNSARTSTTSLKSPGISEVPGGYIKMIDDVGEETGKFYIGATGFLKDDDYEVVIQLRKKPMSKEEGDKPKEGLIKASEHQNQANEVMNCQSDDITTTKQTSVNNTPIIKAHDVGVDATDMMKTEIERKQLNTEAQHNMDLKSKECAVQVTDEALIPRPATSTYTQTSLSPTHRHGYFHMSSSTSTAYMSPPEYVRPNFLRCQNIMDNIDGYKRLSRRNNGEHILHRYLQENNSDCHCRKCRSKIQSDNNNVYDKQITTPPNTEQSNNFEMNRSKIFVCQNDRTVCSSEISNRTKCSSRKCSKPKMNGKSQYSKKNPVNNKKCSKSTRKVLRTESCATNTRDLGKSKIDPFLESYVKRLLALSKEGIKTLQVVNQECSSVSTPGSSIINVKRNKNKIGDLIGNKISLEEIKNAWMEKATLKPEEEVLSDDFSKCAQTICKEYYLRLLFPRMPKKRSIHKVKSLNISKQVSQTKQIKTKSVKSLTSSSKSKEHQVSSSTSESRSCRRNSPTQTEENKSKHKNRQKTSLNQVTKNKAPAKNEINNNQSSNNIIGEKRSTSNRKSKCSKHFTTSSSSSVSSSLLSNNHAHLSNVKPTVSNGSESAVQTADTEIHYLKFAEDKLQNIEKIADLTEKCTLRLSNLAKVLEEVRKNKSSAYGQISTTDSTSDSDRRSDKSRTSKKSSDTSSEPPPTSPKPQSTGTKELVKDAASSCQKFVPLLSGIPLPTSDSTDPNLTCQTKRNSIVSSYPDKDTLPFKHKGRPPPALSRVHLKTPENCFTPHELSTVVETDSPMSLRTKNPSTKDDDNINSSSKNTSNSSECESKIQIMDIQLNEMMLKPFISINEFAKQCNLEGLEEGSNIEDLQKDQLLNEELSSLHSDGSLPDVIAELLKRNIISEPFKFDTASNVNSTTVSSDSMATLSILALSKVKKAKEKSKTSLKFKNKENVVDTSDSLSISSNPDLEYAFKKLGLGWASSTLKKTKERLALSPSSNTSSSSLSQFKLKLHNQEIPVILSDSSILNASECNNRKKNCDVSKDVEQQTSLPQALTVKDFLRNELSKKITFNNKSNRDETEPEFVSLFETKIPDVMQQTSLAAREDCSIESGNNRARTSTPVQIFKSNTYQSSSSSNKSNGLFSNADELSSVKMTSNSMRNHSTSDKDDLTIPNFSLRTKKGQSNSSKSE